MFSTGSTPPLPDIIRRAAALVLLALAVAPADGQLRRNSPDARQIEWREQAGQVELQEWPGEISLREIRPLLEQFFAALQGRAFSDEQVVGLFAVDFAGEAPADARHVATEAGDQRWYEYATGVRLDREEFATGWQQHLRKFERIVRTEFYVDRFETIDDGAARRMLIPFRITGYLPDGRRSEDEGIATVEVRRHADDTSWQLASLELDRLASLRSPVVFSSTVLSPGGPLIDMPVEVFVDYFAQGTSVVDIDGDGDHDVFEATKYGRPRVYRNEGERRFVETGKTLGFADIRQARSGYFFDWDNDGDQDALVLTAFRLYLLESRDGAFHDVSMLSMFDRMSTTGLTGASIADYDNDGYLDFYVANYGDLRYTPVADYFDSRRGFKNQMFRNRGNGTFEIVTRPAGLDNDNDRWSFAAISFDADDDGWQDLYVVNDYGPNQLYRNNGDLTFENVTEEWGAVDFGNGMGVSLGDLDGDGHEDLYVSNMISHAGKRIASGRDFPDDPEARRKMLRFAKGNTLLVAGEGGFVEIDTPVLSDAKWAWGNTLFDYDNDGDPDVYVTNGMFSNLGRKDTDPVFWQHLLAPISAGKLPGTYASGYFYYLLQQESRSFAGYERNRLFHNFGESRFRDVAFTTGTDLVQDGRSVAAADLDGDGALDLVVANRNEPQLVVLWNELPERGNHIEVLLRGSASNRDGIGARVSVTCGESAWTRTHVAGSGYLSQEPQSLWFGIGTCRRADEIRVAWPAGGESVATGVAAGSRVVIRE